MVRQGRLLALLLSASLIGVAQRSSAQAAAQATALPSRKATTISACQLQNGKRLPNMNFRVSGTEPFWGAQVNGRCVTYSTPEVRPAPGVDALQGTPRSKIWVGYLKGRKFELRLTQAPPGLQ